MIYTIELLLPLIFLNISHVFLMDYLEFNLETYRRQDACLLCLIVLRAFARPILNLTWFSLVGLRTNCLTADLLVPINFLQFESNQGLSGRF